MGAGIQDELQIGPDFERRDGRDPAELERRQTAAMAIGLGILCLLLVPVGLLRQMSPMATFLVIFAAAVFGGSSVALMASGSKRALRIQRPIQDLTTLTGAGLVQIALLIGASNLRGSLQTAILVALASLGVSVYLLARVTGWSRESRSAEARTAQDLGLATIAAISLAGISLWSGLTYYRIGLPLTLSLGVTTTCCALLLVFTLFPALSGARANSEQIELDSSNESRVVSPYRPIVPVLLRAGFLAAAICCTIWALTLPRASEVRYRLMPVTMSVENDRGPGTIASIERSGSNLDANEVIAVIEVGNADRLANLDAREASILDRRTKMSQNRDANVTNEQITGDRFRYELESIKQSDQALKDMANAQKATGGRIETWLANALLASQNRMDHAEENLINYRGSSRRSRLEWEKSVASVEAELKQVKIDRTAAMKLVTKHELRVPYRSNVTASTYSVGNKIGAGETLATIESLEEVRVRVSSKLVSTIGLGATVQLRTGIGKYYTGKVTRITGRTNGDAILTVDIDGDVLPYLDGFLSSVP